MVSYRCVVRRSALLTLLVLSMAGGMLALGACSAGMTNNGCASGYAPAENNASSCCPYGLPFAAGDGYCFESEDTASNGCASGYAPAENDASSCCPYGLPFAAGDGYCYESEDTAARFLSLPGRIRSACAPFSFTVAMVDDTEEARDSGYTVNEVEDGNVAACIQASGQAWASDCRACVRAVVEVVYADDTPVEECSSNADCDDGLFCNGSETCDRVSGLCFAGDIPCGNEPCDEARGRCGTDEHEAECTSELEVNAVLEASWQILGLSWLDPSAGVIASAFAVDNNKLATNAHVVLGLVNVLSTGGIAAVVQNETGTELPIVRMWVHPDYNGDSISSPDVAVIEVDGRLPSHLTLGSNATVQNLEVLEELTLCGFPGDVSVLVDFANLQPGDEFRPRASCFTGGISSLRPFDPSVAATEVNSQLIQHSVGTTGGTSGSPMLDDCGVVVAVHAAATLDVAGTNRFATRADALADLLNMIESGAVNPVEIPSGDEPEPVPEPEPEPIFVAGDLFPFLTPEETDYFRQRVAAVNLDIDSLIENELAVIQMDLIDRGLWCSSLYLNALCGAQTDSVSLKRLGTWSVLEEVAAVFGFTLYPLSAVEVLEIDAFNCQEYPGGSVTIEHCGLSMTCIVDESC